MLLFLRKADRKPMRGRFLMALISVVLWAAATAIVASAQTPIQIPSVQTITTRMAQAQVTNQIHFRPYVVTRDYTMFRHRGSDPASQVTANLTFVPLGLKTYAIQRSS